MHAGNLTTPLLAQEPVTNLVWRDNMPFLGPDRVTEDDVTECLARHALPGRPSNGVVKLLNEQVKLSDLYNALVQEGGADKVA